MKNGSLEVKGIEHTDQAGIGLDFRETGHAMLGTETCDWEESFHGI